MRRLVWLLCIVMLAGCGGGARSVPAASGAAGGPNRSEGGSLSLSAGSAVGLSSTTMQFSATGSSAAQTLTTTWHDDSRKSAVSSDPTVATVSPPYQLASWTASGTYTATYLITPVGAGRATLTFSDHDGAESATLSVVVSAPPTGTLYVGGAGEIDAFPAAASGTQAPERRITGFFKPRVHPFNSSSSAGALVVGGDGTLYVVKNSQLPTSNVCEIIAYSTSADGTSGALGSLACGTRGSGLAAGANGELDALVKEADGTTSVLRFVNGHEASRLSIAGEPVALAIGPNGDLYVAQTTGIMSVGRIDQYAAGAAGDAAPVRTILAPGLSFFGSIAVAPNGMLYAVYVVPNYELETSTQTINVYPPGSTTPSRSIGPFPGQHLAALTVDKAGELYVASNAVRYASITSRVDVYARHASGIATPIRTLANPIPSDASGGAVIQSLALSPPDPPPPEEVLSRRKQR